MGFSRWGNPRVKRAGCLLEAEELKRMGSGISKVGQPKSKEGRMSTVGRRMEEGGKWDSQGGGT